MSPGSIGLELNLEQQEAVAELGGPVRVVAGAGTGKTAVIAERFLGLVRSGVPPSAILVMTFTDRAAAEMRGRIESRLESYFGEVWIGTFHSIAQSLLREEGWRIGVAPNFRVLAGADRWILVRELLWELGNPALVGVERPDDLVNPLLRLLERLKQELIPVGRLAEWASACPDREVGDQLLGAVELFKAYRRRCEAERLLDFDDLIARLVSLLESRPPAAELLVKRFTSVLVDEYQDSNLAQVRMVELLGGSGNVCVVGDDDQSIYRFRGASLASMERFARSFPTLRTSRLGENRRSTEPIVAAASALIEHNPDRLAKVLTSARGRGAAVTISHCRNGLDEALHIAAGIGRLRSAGWPLSEIALLVRTNALAQPVVNALRAAAIPHQLWGARGFYRRPEVLDVIAYLRLLRDPRDELALSRVATGFATGLDPAAVLSQLMAGRSEGDPPLKLVEALPEADELVGTIRRLLSLSARLGIDELFFELMVSTRYLEVSSYPTEADRSQVAANLAKFADLIERFRESARDQSLGAFLEYLDLVLLSEADEDMARVEEVADAVQVMTIHQAKGLEFGAVFVPSVVEGRLPQPHRRDRFQVPVELAGEVAGREDQVAEERRLLYVAMTRARDLLELSWADRYEGSRLWRRSRFIDELASADAHLEFAEVAELGVEPTSTGRTVALPPASVPTGVPSIRLSYTAISTYRECPRQFEFRYVFRLPVPDSPEAQFGTIIHAVLLEAGRMRQKGVPVSEQSLQPTYESVWQDLPFSDRRRRPAMKDLGWVQLRRFLAEEGFAEAPAMLEQPFSSQFEGWILHGVIDRIDGPTPTGGWRLVDYKTGDPVPASRLRRDLQLSLYALGAQRALGLTAVELEIVYLKTAGRVVLPADQAPLEEAQATGQATAAAVAAGNFEPRPERRRCALCAYRLACSAAL